MLLANSHVAHDCTIGDGATIANGALLAGCASIGHRAFISGNVVVHQQVSVGELAMIAGQARVSKDVPPYMLVIGDSEVCGLNVVGMRRAGLSPSQRQRVRRVYQILYRSGLNVSQAVERLSADPASPESSKLIAFIAASSRGICRERAARRRSVL